MMSYDIQIETKHGDEFTITVKVYSDGTEVLAGKTSVVVPDEALEEGQTKEEKAREYAENVFLVDLRKNFKALKELVLPCDEPQV